MINLSIGTTALTFQVFVLNPWHKKISKQIDQLPAKIKSI